jgi:hypothetical protein
MVAACSIVGAVVFRPAVLVNAYMAVPLGVDDGVAGGIEPHHVIGWVIFLVNVDNLRWRPSTAAGFW